MGLFRSGFFACLVVGLTAFAQQPIDPNAPAPAPVPGVDPNAPAPILQPATPAPEVDSNVLQPVTPDTSTPAPVVTKPKPKPRPAALPTLRGTAGAIDKTNMTIVVHGKSKDETLKITSKTLIFADNKPAILADAKQGENVVAEYRTAKDKSKEALTLRFGKGAAVAAKKPAARKKPAAPPADTAAPAPDTGVTPLPDATTIPPATVPDPNARGPAPGTPATNP